MRATLSCMLILAFLLGCRDQAESNTSFFRRTSWWERRLDRLDTWNSRHGYILHQTRDAVAVALITTGGLVALVGYLYCNAKLNDTFPGLIDTDFFSSDNCK
jgi:hypothetical protein